MFRCVRNQSPHPKTRLATSASTTMPTAANAQLTAQAFEKASLAVSSHGGAFVPATITASFSVSLAAHGASVAVMLFQ
jgi:hypothetical protein